MDETEFRARLHDALDRGSAPPSMSAAGAVRAGHRAARRRTLLTGVAGAGGLAAATAIGLLVATAGSRAGAPVAGPGGPSTVPAVPASGVGATPSVTPPVPGGSGTKPVWPTGADGSPQGDRTARAGRKADAAKTLATHVASLVPAGFTADPAAPTNLTQAQFEDRVAGQDRWSYLVTLRISQGGGAGQLIVEVREPGLLTQADLCAVPFWTEPAGCRIVTSGGHDVAVTTGAPGENRIAKWATYRHPDGTTVVVALAAVSGAGPEPTDPPLTRLPFDDQGLAALTLDPALHVVA